MRREDFGKNEGVISLEACIIVPLFLFMILFFYGFLMLFLVRNNIAHSMVEATKSLSLDIYLPAHFGTTFYDFDASEGDMESASDVLFTFFDKASMRDTEYFVSIRNWSEGLGDLNEIAKKRFYAYFTGQGKGSDPESKALELLKAGGIENVSVTAEVVGDDIVMTVEYDYRYLFDMHGTTGHTKQTATSRIWKPKED